MIAVLASTLVQMMVSMKFQVMSGDKRSTDRITCKRSIDTMVTLGSSLRLAAYARCVS